jgi:hypothetical protein
VRGPKFNTFPFEPSTTTELRKTIATQFRLMHYITYSTSKQSPC